MYPIATGLLTVVCGLAVLKLSAAAMHSSNDVTGRNSFPHCLDGISPDPRIIEFVGAGVGACVGVDVAAVGAGVAGVGAVGGGVGVGVGALVGARVTSRG